MTSRTASTAAAELIPANTVRKSLAIQNEDSTDSVWIMREAGQDLTVSSTIHDWKLPPGGSLTFNSLLDGLKAVQARYTIVASANTPRINFFESEDIQR